MSTDNLENVTTLEAEVCSDTGEGVPDADLATLLGPTFADAELRFRAVLESLAEGIAIFDRTGVLVFCNPQFASLTGYEPIEMYGKKVFEIFFPAGSREQDEYLQKMLDRYQARQQGYSEVYVSHIFRKNGERRWLETRAAPLRSLDGRIIGSIGANTDITQRRVLEDQVQWSERMDAVGRLAGGVAHNFNNLLTVICGYADLLLRALPPSDSNRRKVDLIRQSAETACEITGQLLALSRKTLPQKEIVDLNRLVESTSEMIRGLLNERTTLSIDSEADDVAVFADRSQLQQVILNLLINARDALGDGGRIAVKIASTVIVNEVNTIGGGLMPGTYVVLSVEDTGKGISPDQQLHIFEPFYSSGKENGHGLGLSTSYALIKQMGGEILLRSEVGVGTCFDIYLPQRSTEAPVRRAWTKGVSVLDGDETVLIAEDEGTVRRLVAEVLEQHGYTVIEARDGLEALEVLTNSPSKPDLIISDVVMASIDGPTLASKVMELSVDTKMILISGYAADAAIAERIEQLGLPLLAKPFTPEALLQLVRAVLDRRGRGSRLAGNEAIGW